VGNELDLPANSIGKPVQRATTWRVANFAALFLLALVTGVFWGTWFSLTRAIETFSASEFIHIGQTIIANVAWPMKVLMPSCILFMIVSTWSVPDKKSSAFYLSLLACLFILIALLITLLVEVPIDNQIRSWTPETVPADWTILRARAGRCFTPRGQSFHWEAWAV
jgi:hypothetical protein